MLPFKAVEMKSDIFLHLGFELSLEKKVDPKKVIFFQRKIIPKRYQSWRKLVEMEENIFNVLKIN